MRVISSEPSLSRRARVIAPPKLTQLSSSTATGVAESATPSPTGRTTRSSRPVELAVEPSASVVVTV